MAIAGSATFLCSIVGGYVADSRYLLKVIKGINLFSALMCFIFVGMFFYQHHIDLWQINTAVFLLNINSYLSSPIFKKMIHFFVEHDSIVSFNQALALGAQIISVVVPPVSTFLYSWHVLDLQGAFIVNGLSFLGAFFFLKPFELASEPARKFTGYTQTFKNIFSNVSLLQFLFMGVMLNFFLSGLNIFFPIMVIHKLHQGSLYGAVLASQAVGGILGAASISKVPSKNNLLVERIGLVLIAVALGLLTVIQSMWFIFIVSTLISVVLSRYNIASQSIVQREVKRELIGKTFSAIFIFANMAIPLGSLLFGHIINISINLTLMIIAGGFIVFNLMWIFIDRKYTTKA